MVRTTVLSSVICAAVIGVITSAPDGKVIKNIWKRKYSNETSAESAVALLKEMTLSEKIVMLHGVPTGPYGYVGYVPGNDRLGIPALKLNDGYVKM